MEPSKFTSPMRLYQKSKELFDSHSWDEQVKEWIRVLVIENENLKKEAHVHVGFCMVEAANVALMVSHKLKLHTNVKYLALDIYQRFAVKHVETLTKIVANEILQGDTNVLSILSVQEKVGAQAPLRVITCLRIASKLTSHNKIISGEIVRKLLKELGYEYSLKSVNKSEVRILNEISFRCRAGSTVLEYVGVLVAYVGTMDLSSSGPDMVGTVVDDLYRSCIHLLDITYLKYDTIYNELYYKITESKPSDINEELRLAFARIRTDRMLLSCSLVAASAWLLGGEGLSHLVTGRLVQASRVPADDISVMASCILEQATDDTEDSQS